MRPARCSVARDMASLLMFVAAVFTAPAMADDRFWIDTTLDFNNWSDPDNWSPNDDFAKAGDNAIFDQDAAYFVIVAAPSAADNVTFSDGDVTLGGGSLNTGGIVTIAGALGDEATVTINGPNWDNVGDAFVGGSGTGTLHISGTGDFRSEDIFIGNDVDSVGVVTVDGVGSTLQTDGLDSGNGFYIGNAGTGTLNVTGGGLARIVNDVTGGIADFLVGEAASGEGILNIDGAGSSVIAEDVLIGNFGTGHLNVTAGGVFTQNIGGSPNAFVAQQLGSSGDVTVSGDGSEWTMARLEIGNLGDATLSIEAGGLVRSNTGDMTLGDAGGSGSVAIFGAGSANSTLDVTNDLYVGNLGLGQLSVGQDLSGTTDGNGTLEVGSDLFIGSAPSNNMDNKLVVSGANASAMVGGNLLAGGTIEAGAAGTGTLEARDGATISIGGALSAGAGPDADGTILIDGLGTTLTSSTMFLGNGNDGPQSVGTMTVSDQAVVTFTSSTGGVVTLGDEGFGEGTLTVTGSGSLVESTGGTAEWWIGGSSNDTGGTGTLNVLDGGKATSTGTLVIAHGSAAEGSVVVDGVGSQLNAGGAYILVGYSGVGDMDVTNGGTVNANRMLVGDATGSDGSRLDIDGAGSVVDIGGLLIVGDSDSGIVNVTGGGQLNVATDNLADRLIIGDEAPTDSSRLTVSGTGSRVDYFGTERVSVGFVGGGSFDAPVILEVIGGAVFEMEHEGVNSSIGLFVADEPNSAGLVTVDGTGSRLHTSKMYVSDSTGTRGTVDITEGGVMEVDEFVEIGSAGDGDGFLTVAGAGSRLDVGGDLSAAAGASNLRVDGTITITDGGAVTNGDQGFIGRATTNVGTVNVGGAGALATWDVGTDLFIAGNDALTAGGSQISGSGTINVLANGRVTVADTLVLKDRGVINLDGGELAADNFLFQDFAERALSPTVNFNSGTLRYTTGKTLAAGDLDRIFNAGSQELTAGRHLAVDGIMVLNAPLRINGGTLSIGNTNVASMDNLDFDTGTLNLTQANLVVGASGLFGEAIVIDLGQTVNVTNQATVDAGAELTILGEFSSGGLTNNGDLIVIDTTGSGKAISGAVDSPAGSNITLVGDIEFADLVSGGADFYGPGSPQFSGGYSPGDSPAEITFESGLVLSDTNTLYIEIGGTTPGDQYDTLSIAGDAVLDGTLSVMLDGFTPTAGQQFTILTASSVTDLGLVLGGPNANSFSLVVGSDSVVLQAIVGSLQGDFNGDGIVNLADYTVWRNNLGAADDAAINNAGDNLPGVTTADYDIWKANFGATAATASATITPVPEPSTVCTLLLVALGVGGWRVMRPVRC